MAECKDCLYSKNCQFLLNRKTADANGCTSFEDKSEWVKLPCKAGDTIFLPWEWNGEYASQDGYGAIIELMKTLEVDSWEGLQGQYVRVRIGGWGEKIYAIGHLIKDQWFSWDDYFATVRNKKEVRNHE